MEISNQYKERVIKAIFSSRENYTGSDTAFAKTIGLNGAVFSRLKNGETEQLVSDAKWLHIGRILDVKLRDKKWNTARTAVYNKV